MEEHLLEDGSSHYTDHCPTDCPVRTGLERLLADLQAGRVVVRRAS